MSVFCKLTEEEYRAKYDAPRPLENKRAVGIAVKRIRVLLKLIDREIQNIESILGDDMK